MNGRHRYASWQVNLLIATAISLVVNFSYMLLLIVESRDEGLKPKHERNIVYEIEGRLSLTPDGYGYVIYDRGGIDSVYVPSFRIHRLELADGDRMVVDIVPPRNQGGHYAFAELKSRNGEEFDPRTMFDQPSRTLEFIWQICYYLLFSFITLTILTARVTQQSASAKLYAQRCLWCIAVVVPLYLFAPVIDGPGNKIVLNFTSHRYFDYILLLKCSFALALTLLYGRIYVMLHQQQAILTENEVLKNENLTTRYNMLVGQINPHFFFNSLNSLAMLVRERLNDKALTYIDQLSYTFRYIIQNGQTPLATLDEELKFAEAYGYLFKIRYADKLFFDIEVDDEYRHWLLPALTLQPLIGNAVKHNTITRSRPFHISIRTEQGYLIVSNPRIPRLEPEPSTGIGLENLRNRWRLIAGREFEIIRTEQEFTVKLPLRKEEK